MHQFTVSLQPGLKPMTFWLQVQLTATELSLLPVCVCVCVCVCVYVRVHAFKKEREREHVSAWVCVGLCFTFTDSWVQLQLMIYIWWIYVVNPIMYSFSWVQEELAVHKKKVEDITFWLKERTKCFAKVCPDGVTQWSTSEEGLGHWT